MKIVRIMLKDEVHKDFKIKCIENSISMNSCVNQFVRDYLSPPTVAISVPPEEKIFVPPVVEKKDPGTIVGVMEDWAEKKRAFTTNKDKKQQVSVS